MEVLTLQNPNQYQSENFKNHDWQSPLTPPPTSTIIDHQQIHQNLILNNLQDDDNLIIEQSEIDELSQRLQSELRYAKSRHLECTEVLLPSDLLNRISCEIIRFSEKEPCGIRGCTLYIEFEDEPQNSRRIASIKLDSNTVSTFELYLTIRHDKSGWTSILPQFLKNLTRSSTIMISPEYSLTKNKLYNSFME